jgi:hypothetical protein
MNDEKIVLNRSLPINISLSGMSEPNEWYLRRNGNSRTTKIPKICTGLILLLSLGKIFRAIFLPHFPNENHCKVKKANIDSNLPFIFIKA